MENIKTIAFDFGGTLDVPGVHWFDFFWSLFEGHLPYGKEIERGDYFDAYVFAEREIERKGIPSDTSLYDTLLKKLGYQIAYLNQEGYMRLTQKEMEDLGNTYAIRAFNVVQLNLLKAEPILKELSSKYTLYIVSNYYGNLKYILDSAQLATYITEILDSTTVGVRKPDPAIWKMALDRSGNTPDEFLVVGDSMKNDILPALSLGCPTVLINQVTPSQDYTGPWITSLEELTKLLEDSKA